jgi:hypothetical protein
MEAAAVDIHATAGVSCGIAGDCPAFHVKCARAADKHAAAILYVVPGGSFDPSSGF